MWVWLSRFWIPSSLQIPVLLIRKRFGRVVWFFLFLLFCVVSTVCVLLWRHQLHSPRIYEELSPELWSLDDSFKMELTEELMSTLLLDCAISSYLFRMDSVPWIGYFLVCLRALLNCLHEYWWIQTRVVFILAMATSKSLPGISLCQCTQLNFV